MGVYNPKLIAIGGMNREELDAELEKGVESLESDETYTADEVDHIIAKAQKIIDERAQIDAKNRTDREDFLKKQADFRKRFANTQSDIQALRESIRQTMPNK